MKRHWVRSVLNLAVLLFFLIHVSGYVTWGFVEHLENWAYDQRITFTMPDTQDNRIVIVDIDEKSLKEEGRWPWPRYKLAKLMDRMFDDYGVAIVGFDVVFAEPDESSGLSVLERLEDKEFKGDDLFARKLEEIRPELNYDQIFADSIKGRAVVLGYYFSDKGIGGDVPQVGQLPDPAFRAGHFTGRKITFIGADGFGANLAQLQENAAAAGHFNPFIDNDGVVRRVTMLYEYDGAHYESLSLAVARIALGVDKVEPQYADASMAGKNYAGLEWLSVGDRLIPVDGKVRTLVPYRGLKGSFPYIPAADILHQRVEKGKLENTIVLVGTSAPGLLDLRAAPVQKVFPGVEIHANLIAGILDRAIKENPAYTLGVEFVILVLSGLILTIAYTLLGPVKEALLTLAMIVIVIIINMLIWIQGNLVLPISATMMMILAMFLLNMSYGFFVESRGKRQLAGLFGQYVPPELVDEMGDDPDSYSLEAESRELTVLFSDVRGFTTISEGLKPKELSEMMNLFLTPLTGVIHQHRGTIDKYMGDAIMAFWGAPIADSEHARHALNSAMEMIRTLDGMQDEFKAKGWPEVRIGVGLNTGPMSVGNMGSEFRMAYTILGDAVNLGSRLEGLTRQYGVDIIVSNGTRKLVPEYVYRELDRVRVKGKDKPVVIFEPIGLKDSVEKAILDELALYKQAVKLYRSQNWDMAELQFLNLQQKSPSLLLYKVYAERVANYRQNPPGANWDGVYTFKTK
ncbi:MAG: adenylate/guanylate cyclase domain-containing protein [Gammaproteobacteria bacterium]|nr:adenylate/guanylate cyclase domain-containing protein [Gammaproteobacteria bacterium]